jgi:hypothetical protein
MDLIMNATTPNGKWQEVSRSKPCQICGKPDWCRIAGDGLIAACRRVDVGAFRTKTDRSGSPVYLHHIVAGSNGNPSATDPPRRQATRAEPSLIHDAYTVLLGELRLSEGHRDQLRQRGLPDGEIDSRGYRSLHVQGRAKLARTLREAFGDSLLKVPGFIVKEREARRYVTNGGSAGLLIPVRDLAGRMLAVKVRRDDSGKGPRYSYLSSTRYGGPGPGAAVHVPLGTEAPAKVVRLTEGELKADLATVLGDVATISAPGVTNWRPCLDAVKSLGAEVVRLAFDMDAFEKAPVARALLQCSEALIADGLQVELERWPLEGGKGIDDLLANGGIPELLAGDEATAAINEIAKAAGVRPDDPDSAIDRLDDVLASGGAAAFFLDSELLKAIARTKVDDPARFASIRASIDGRVSRNAIWIAPSSPISNN